MRASDLDLLRNELFALCEHTENGPVATEFDRGRVFEAKGIRRTMGEIFRLAKLGQLDTQIQSAHGSAEG
jgi:hypothetical protein